MKHLILPQIKDLWLPEELCSCTSMRTWYLYVCVPWTSMIALISLKIKLSASITLSSILQLHQNPLLRYLWSLMVSRLRMLNSHLSQLTKASRTSSDISFLAGGLSGMVGKSDILLEKWWWWWWLCWNGQHKQWTQLLPESYWTTLPISFSCLGLSRMVSSRGCCSSVS